MATKNDKDVESTSVRQFTSSDLELLDLSADGLTQFMADLGLSIEDVSFEASSFTVTAKSDLIDVPLFIVSWRFSESDSYKTDDGAPALFAVVHALAYKNAENSDEFEKVIITDGGTGLCEQLQVKTAQRQAAGMNERQSHAGLAVKNGLVRSDYGAHLNAAGVEVPAGTTFYLG